MTSALTESNSTAWQPSDVNTGAQFLNQFMDMASDLSDKNNAYALESAQNYNNWQADQARIARQFNAQEAAKNRQWQEYMSNTAHQREVKDLQNAGLNPVLSATGGNGAAVGSGASASAQNATGSKSDVDMGTTQAMVGLLGKALDSITTLEASNNSARQAESQTDKINATTLLANAVTNQTNKDVANISGQYHYQSAKYQSDSNYAAAKYGADTSYNIARNFPNSWPALLNAGVGSLFGDDSATNFLRNAVSGGATTLGDVLEKLPPGFSLFGLGTDNDRQFWKKYFTDYNGKYRTGDGD